MDFILARIKEKTLFSTLDLDATTYWEHLVWMDGSNHGGIKEVVSIAPEMSPAGSAVAVRNRRKIIADSDDDEEEEENPNAALDEMEEDAMSQESDGEFGSPARQMDAVSIASALDLPEGTASMNWNISEFLSSTGRELFTTVIGEWIFMAWKARMAEREMRSGVARTPIKTRPRDDEDEDELEGAASDALNLIRQKLMTSVPQLEKVRVWHSAVFQDEACCSHPFSCPT
jgi:hypothetical protein